MCLYGVKPAGPLIHNDGLTLFLGEAIRRNLFLDGTVIMVIMALYLSLGSTPITYCLVLV